MSNIKIVTDSGCDIPLKTKLKNVEILSFFINVDGKTYEERKDISFREYYKVLETCAKIPTTAHITMMRYGEKFETLMRQGATDIIVVTINKGASATYDAAVMAKQMFMEENPDCNVNIHIIDSGCYSMAYGWPIMQCDKMIEDGVGVQQIISFLNSKFEKAEILLSAYTLRFMKKSGRISAAAAFAGEVMGLKPIITMKHGDTEVVQKVRGDKAVIPAIVQQFKKRHGEEKNYIIGYTDEEYGKELYSACVKEIGYPPVLSFELGSAVATNAGNHCVAIAYTGQ